MPAAQEERPQREGREVARCDRRPGQHGEGVGERGDVRTWERAEVERGDRLALARAHPRAEVDAAIITAGVAARLASDTREHGRVAPRSLGELEVGVLGGELLPELLGQQLALRLCV